MPGVSSCIAIPAAAGIPVTHRGVSRSFHVVTGRTAENDLPEDIESLAALRGTLGDIARRAREAGAQAPAVIVVGDVASLDLRGAEAAPVRVGLVGTPSFTRRAADELRALGARPALCVTARVRPLEIRADWASLAEKRAFLVVTSRNGADRFFERLRASGTDVRSLAACRFAAIGPATGEALAQRGVFADVFASPATSEALAAALARAAAPGGTAARRRSSARPPPGRSSRTRCAPRASRWRNTRRTTPSTSPSPPGRDGAPPVSPARRGGMGGEIARRQSKNDPAFPMQKHLRRQGRFISSRGRRRAASGPAGRRKALFV